MVGDAGQCAVQPAGFGGRIVDRSSDQEDPDQAERNHPCEVADDADRGDRRSRSRAHLGRLILLEELP